MKIEKKLLFELLNSHSTLSEKEYKRNSEYNSEHYSHKIEMKIIELLSKNNLLQEYFDYSEANILEF